MRLFLCCGVYLEVPFGKKQQTTIHIPGTAAHELGRQNAIDPRRDGHIIARRLSVSKLDRFLDTVYITVFKSYAIK
jgi:hypothetical protein